MQAVAQREAADPGLHLEEEEGAGEPLSRSVPHGVELPHGVLRW